MRPVTYAVDAAITAAALQIKIQVKHPMTWVGGIVSPVMFMCLLFAPGRPSSLSNNATAMLVGVALASLWSASLWGAMGILRRERAEGTLGATLTGVPNPLLTVVAKMGGATFLQLLIIGAVLISAAPLFGTELNVQDPTAFSIGIAAVIVGGCAASLLLGSVLVVSRHGFQLTAAVGPPILLLGGMLIPLSALPPWAAWVGLFVNLRWLREFLVSAATGTTQWSALIIALILTCLYAAIGILVFYRMLRRARKEATLELI